MPEGDVIGPFVGNSDPKLSEDWLPFLVAYSHPGGGRGGGGGAEAGGGKGGEVVDLGAFKKGDGRVTLEGSSCCYCCCWCCFCWVLVSFIMFV